MNSSRRQLLSSLGALTACRLAVAAGFIVPGSAMAAFFRNQGQFNAKSIDEFYKTLPEGLPEQTDKVRVLAPPIAENGAVVPLGAISELPATTEMYFLIANNPAVLSSKFVLPEGTDPEVNTRVKMNKTGDVYAMVKADGKFYFNKMSVKITRGGCGG